MSKDDLNDILEPVEEEQEAVAQPEPEQGEQEPAQEPEQPEPEEKPAMVPLKALHEERDARRADSERLKALEAELEALKAPKQEPQTVPDMFEDPEGYNAYWESRLNNVQQSNQTALLNERLNLSERYATEKHGADVVEATKKWFAERVQENPAFQGHVLGQVDPYAFAVDQFQREQFMQSVDASELEQFRAWKAQGEVPATMPKTTANSRSVGKRGETKFVEDTLDDILGS